MSSASKQFSKLVDWVDMIIWLFSEALFTNSANLLIAARSRSNSGSPMITMAKGRAAFYAMRQAAAEAGIQDMSLDEIN